MAFAFEKLVVYQKSVDFAEVVCAATGQFPRGHYFLADHLNRAGLSIAANIAEGNARFTAAERRIFAWVQILTLYYVLLRRETEKAYLFLADTERDAEEYADDLRRADPEAVTRELVFWKDAEKWVDEGSYPPPSFAGKLRPKCIDGPLVRQSISTERPDQVIRAYRYDKDGHHGTYILEGRANASGYYWYPGEVARTNSET